MNENIFLNKQKGFTLMELMIVIAILAIAVSIASPAYSDFAQRSQVKAVAKDFQSALESAKHHARTSGRQMTVCATADVSAEQPECQDNFDGFGEGGGENVGWVVFRDLPDSDGKFDKKASGAGEVVVKRIPFSKNKVRVVSNGRAVIHLSPRNRTGDTGTVCFYYPKGGATLDECSANAEFNSKLFEVRVVLSALGKATFKQ